MTIARRRCCLSGRCRRCTRTANTMNVQLMYLQLRRVFAKERASRALPPIMYLKHVRRKPFGACCFVLTQTTCKGLRVGVQMSFQTPIINTAPRTV